MNPFRLFQPGKNPWTNGLRLALLNVVLAVFCAGSFMGVLALVAWLNQLRLADDGTSSILPFPYHVLLLLYSIIYASVWAWFGRHLPTPRRERTITALVGAGPLFGLSLFGYAGLIVVIVVGEFDSDFDPAASFFVLGGIATLVLFAGIMCVGMISLVKGQRPG